MAEGVELLGRYDGSGYRTPTYLARRSDGQVIQLPEILYAIVENANGARDTGAIAAAVAERVGRGLEADDVEYLLREKLAPLGLLDRDDARDGDRPSQAQGARVDPLLALKFKTKVVPARAVSAITALFLPLFWTPVVAVVLVGLVALDGWLFGVHGVAPSIRATLYEPLNVLVILGLAIASAAFHEIGHATACRYGGGKPGVMGVGLYIAWPAFYTDVTDAYRLGKRGRLRTDLGGVYFNVVFLLAAAGAYFATGYEPLLLLVVVSHFEIAHQFLPFLRLDGYYVVADITGVPDLFARIKPILRSLIPGREPEPSVRELKPWARAVVTAWVLLVIPIIAVNLGLLALHAPRIYATAWDSMGVQAGRMGDAFGEGAWVVALATLVAMLALAIPVIGIGLTFTRIGHRSARAAWRATDGRPVARVGLSGLVGMGMLALGALWWPNGDYRPIGPSERGTIGEAVSSLSGIAQGRPAGVATTEAPGTAGTGGAPRQTPTETEPTSLPSGTAPRTDPPPDAQIDTAPSEEPAPSASSEPPTSPVPSPSSSGSDPPSPSASPTSEETP